MTHEQLQDRLDGMFALDEHPSIIYLRVPRPLKRALLRVVNLRYQEDADESMNRYCTRIILDAVMEEMERYGENIDHLDPEAVRSFKGRPDGATWPGT